MTKLERARQGTYTVTASQKSFQKAFFYFMGSKKPCGAKPFETGIPCIPCMPKLATFLD